MAAKYNTFAKGSGVYTCEVCKKKTRKTDPDSADLGLCHLCYEVAGFENLHSDSDHEGKIQNCDECLSQMSEAEKNHCLAHPDLFS